MKRGKIIILLCLLICIILSLQSVAAATDDLNTANVTNNNALSIPDSNNGVLGAGGGSFYDLNQTINGNSDNVINLNQSYTYNPATDSAFSDVGIIISRDLTINGNGYTIDAANHAGIFVVRASVSMNNIVFVNGNYSSHGGAIDYEDFSGSTITGCTFINNTAAGDGGAIFWRSGAHDGIISNCIFINNTAGLNGGAVAWYISAERGTILDSIFINNTAYRSAGAVLWFGHDGKVINSRFSGNKALGMNDGPDAYGNTTAGGDGGAILLVGADGIVDNCTFICNNASDRGGAIFLEGGINIECDNTTVKSSKFINNYAGTNGGAVDWHEDAHDGAIFDSIFENNIADANGGAVYWRGHHGDIIRSNFTNNTAKGLTKGRYGNNGDGGAVLWAGVNGTVDACRFIGNKAIHNSTSTTNSGRGGAVYLEPCYHGYCENTSFHNSYFEDNVAGTNGGAIYWHEGAREGLVENCTFNHNIANRSAAAIFWIGIDGYVYDSTFTNNEAHGKIAGTTVHTNDTITTGGSGGAIIWAGSNGILSNVKFINNTAAKHGGGIFLEKSAVTGDCNNVTLISCIFENNVAEANGGAVAWDEGATNGTVDNCIFNNNTAKRNGGAIFWNGHNGAIKNSKFNNNRATGENHQYNMTVNMGDQIVIGENGTLILGNIIVIQNSVLPHTTPISSDKNKLFVLNYTKTSNGNTIHAFESWVADGDDDNLVWLKLDETTVNIETISPVDWAIDQFFGGDGGTILWSGDIGLVKNCTFIDSNSARRGGGAYMTGSDYVTYESCNFTNCTSGTNGGGVDWLAGANYGKIYNCIFNNTRAARSAGAIYYDGWYGDMRNITIINTQSWGGTLKTSKDGRVKYAGWDSSHWDTNTTGGDAGAIMFTGNHEYLYNVSFINCNGSGRGGAVFLQDNYNVTFDNCIFRNNIAAGTAKNTYNDDKNISSGLNEWLTGYGGAIAFDVGAHLGIIKECEFINNTAIRIGGAISFGKGSYNGIISDSTFHDNTAYRNGGAIAWDGTNGTMNNCIFTNNAALGTDINRDIFDLKNLSDIINGTSVPDDATPKDKIYILIQYNGNQRANYTMYVYSNDKNAWLPIEFTTETGPSTIDWTTDEYSGGDGGTIYWRGDNGTVDNCKFYDSNSARRGGGAYMTGSDHITFMNSYFENCTSGTNGGGLDWLAGANYGKVINCTFNNTRAARSAGAIYYDGDYGRMENITIINTRSWGSALKHSTYGRDTVIFAGWDASHWDTNTTGGDAGAIMFTGDHEYVYNVTFINCTSEGRGGAVFLQDNYNITFDNCIFLGNEALGTANNTWNEYKQEYDGNGYNYKLTGHGGAIAFDIGAHSVIIKNSEFIYNYARRDGGAINIAENSYNATIENSIFTNNSCGDDGGAINWEGDLGTVKNITCYNNTGVAFADPVTGNSTSKGGTICITGDNVIFTESSFTLGTVLYNKGKLNETDAGAIFITGENTTISHSTFDRCYSPNQAGAIKVIGNNTSLINCTFTNCNATVDGGAIYAAGNNVTINESNFRNCTVTHYNDEYYHGGGSIYVKGDNGIVSNSKFDQCNAKLGGVMFIEGHNAIVNNITTIRSYSNSAGGAIFVKGENGTIKNSNISMTYANVDGGAIYIHGANTTISDTIIEMCYSFNDGGAIYVNGTLATIENCKISKTNTTNDGGAIYINGTNAKILNSTFKLAHSNVKGGVIYVFGENATINQSSFSLCYAEYGGAVYVEGDNAIIVGATVSMSNSTEDGGAFYVEGLNCKLYNSTFQRNFAGDDGGAVLWYGNYGLIDNVTFVNNRAIGFKGSHSKGGSINIIGDYTVLIKSKFLMTSATVDGGAIYVTGNNVTISKSSFNKCNVSHTVEAGYNHGGGCIYVEGDLANIVDCDFDQSNAKLGGIIFIEGNDVTIDNITTKHSFVPSSGGAVFVQGNNAIIKNSSISMTNASFDGGAIYIHGVNTTISGTSIGMCYADKNGGSIYINGTLANIKNCTISISKAVNGGAIYIDGTYANIEGSKILITNATQKGGAVYILGIHATIKDSNFTLNFAQQAQSKYVKDSNLGGSVYIEGNNANIVGSIFDTSSAYEGGIIYLKGNYCNVTNSTLKNGYSFNDGGAVYSTGSYSNVYYSNFTNNVAKSDGGAIFWFGTSSTPSKYNYMVGCIFDNNTAYCDPGHSTKGGGAIYFSENGLRCGIKDCKFFNNSVQSSSKADGGAILWDKSSHIFIDNCLFDGNYATSSATADGIYVQGGVMYARPTTNLTISNSVFKNCWSQREAGALYLQGGSSTLGIYLINNTFINNTAKGSKIVNDNDFGGGAILVKSLSILSIKDCKFINNTANNGGGIRLQSSSNPANFQIINTTFDGNKATLGGEGCGYGGSIYGNVKFTTDNLTISNSKATLDGGGIYLVNVDMPYTTLTFINNSAGVNGGGLYWNRQSVNLDGMVFINNSAGDSGGAIYLPNGGTSSLPLKVINGIFTGNSAEYGGAIFANGGYVVISNDNFTNNNAFSAGGAIFTPLSNNGIDIGYSNFIANTASEGGAIYSGVKGYNDRNIHDCNFTNNSALNGGAIYIANDNQVIINCNFNGNNATGDGGAVYVMSGLQSVNIRNSQFKNSHANNGGAVYYGGTTGSKPLVIKDSDFIKNTAVHNGGAVLFITNNGLNTYRDYNNFDGIGVISETGRTTVKTNDTGFTFIDNCLFEDNEDYMLRIKVISDWQYPFIAVYLDNPRDWKSDKLKFVVNLTNATTHQVISSVIVNSSNIDIHYRDGMLYVSFADLIIDELYNITVSFEDRDYMYKVNSTTIESHGQVMGQFKLLQKLIDEAVGRGDSEIV